MENGNLETDAYIHGLPHNGTDTSINAAATVADVPTKRRKVLNAIKEHGGLSNEQIANILNMPIQTVCARCRELQLKGLVMDSGLRVETAYGRKAKVWVYNG